ncbi:unnamed protein product [Musa acuminata subsp. burmannicoides]
MLVLDLLLRTRLFDDHRQVKLVEDGGTKKILLPNLHKYIDVGGT